MKHIPAISIIIPSYNVERFIEDCIESIFNQSFTDFEVIVVDDGSTDKTRDIINQYSDRHNNLKLITQSNSGQSVARNKGIEASKGKFIVFVDSDDWFTDRYSLQQLYSKACDSKSDFVQAGFCYVKGDKVSEYTINPQPDLKGDVILTKMLQVDNLYTAPWGKIYSSKFIKDNNIRFIEGLVNEDTAFSIEVAAFADRVSFLPINVYSSREREGSTSRTSFKRMFRTMDDVLSKTRKKLKFIGKFSPNIEKSFEARYVRSIMYNLFQSAQRNSYKQFKEDYNFCLSHTSYKNSLKYNRYLPVPHRIFSFISLYPSIFFCMARLIKAFGYIMH